MFGIWCNWQHNRFWSCYSWFEPGYPNQDFSKNKVVKLFKLPDREIRKLFLYVFQGGGGECDRMIASEVCVFFSWCCFPLFVFFKGKICISQFIVGPNQVGMKSVCRFWSDMIVVFFTGSFRHTPFSSSQGIWASFALTLPWREGEKTKPNRFDDMQKTAGLYRKEGNMQGKGWK